VSPKTSSLAYDELGVESSSLFEGESLPELNLIIPKRTHLNTDANALDRAVSITGCITVSF
jgi:hypothetical protein